MKQTNYWNLSNILSFYKFNFLQGFRILNNTLNLRFRLNFNRKFSRNLNTALLVLKKLNKIYVKRKFQ